MRAHYLQHVAFEGLGTIEHWLDAARYIITGTQFFRGDNLPNPTDLDLLVIMGGPMSVNDESTHSWLVQEKAFVRACIERGLPVLSVCLGAQVIASAFGARVYRNPVKEIGWFPIERVTASGAAFQFPPRTDVFHWHGETFDLPVLVDTAGQRTPAIHLARSEGCEHQAFQLGRRTVGLQFHLEMTPESIHKLIEHCSDELLAAPYIQTATRMLELAPKLSDAMHGQMNELLAYLVAS